MTASKALSNRQIARAALVVLLGFLASGVLGVIRSAIIAGIFGAGAAPDAFSRAQQIPELVFVLVAGGALGSSFIPVFARLRENNDETAWQLASTVMTLSAVAAALLSVVVMIFAPWIVQNILAPGTPLDAQALTVNLTRFMPVAHGVTPAYQDLTIQLTRLMMVTPVIFSASGLLMGILQTYQQFLLPSIAIAMNSVGLIIGALVFARMLPPDTGVGQVGDANIYGLAYGAILSAVLHLAVQLPGLRRVHARLRPLFDWRAPGVLEVLRLMGPRVLGLAVVRVNFIVNAAFTSVMVYGSVTVLTNAFTLMFFALGIIAQSVGQAVFPTLSALAAEGDMDGFKGRLAAAVRSVLFLSFPATVALVFLGKPLVRVMFERGEWTAENTAGAAWALAFYAIGIAGFSLLEVLSRAFYALADTWTPVKVGIAAMVSNLVLSVVLIQVIGEPGNLARGPFAGLALANAVTTIFEALALWWLLRRRIGDLKDAYILDGAGRAALAALGMGAALWVMLSVLDDGGGLVMLAGGGAIGAVVFFGLSLLLGVNEARTVPRLLLRRVRR